MNFKVFINPCILREGSLDIYYLWTLKRGNIPGKILIAEIGHVTPRPIGVGELE